VAAEDETAFELEQQVLADRLDPLEPLAGQAFGEPERLGPGMRRLDLDALPDERL
jgi:hypothetical protein